MSAPSPTIKLLSLPYAVLLKSEDHIDRVLARSDDPDLPSEICDTLRAIIEEYADLRAANRTLAEASVADGIYRGDVELPGPPEMIAVAVGYREALDRLDEQARAAGRQDLVASPDVVTFRHWVTDEIKRQVADGARPSPAPL